MSRLGYKHEGLSSTKTKNEENPKIYAEDTMGFIKKEEGKPIKEDIQQMPWKNQTGYHARTRNQPPSKKNYEEY